jgi:hypothetical protein
MGQYKMIITLENIKSIESERGHSVIVRSRVNNGNTVPRYVLQETLKIKLSNGDIITIPRGFTWDLSSVPRLLWGLLPPDGLWEIGSLIHDYLYINKLYSREFADKEMLIWSKVTSGTQNKLSLRNLDNYVRYYGVRLGGWYVWNKRKSFKN